MRDTPKEIVHHHMPPRFRQGHHSLACLNNTPEILIWFGFFLLFLKLMIWFEQMGPFVSKGPM